MANALTGDSGNDILIGNDMLDGGALADRFAASAIPERNRHSHCPA